MDCIALQGTELPFNKYSWLTTHNSFAVTGTPSATGAPIVSPPNQEDSVTSQLGNGVRGIMLDTYDFKNDLWLCHSFAGKCYDFTAYVRPFTTNHQSSESRPRSTSRLIISTCSALQVPA